MKYSRKIRLWLLLVITFLFISMHITQNDFAAYANSFILEVENDLNEVKESQTILSEQLFHLEDEYLLLDEEMKEIDKRIREFDEKTRFLQERKLIIEEEITEKNSIVGSIKEEIKIMEERKDTLQNYLNERARAIYQTESNYGYLEVILGSTSFGNFLDRMIQTRRIQQFDQDMVTNAQQISERLEEGHAFLKDEIKALEDKKEMLEEMNDRFNVMRQERTNYMTTVIERLQEKRDAIEQTEDMMKRVEGRQKELEQELERRKELLRYVPEGASGMFILPTVGVHSSGFGPRWGSMHNGIDIANRPGTDIVASVGGTVRWANYVDGYGNTVLIRHTIDGKTYETLYAHMNRIDVKIGQSVKQGQKIGEMGSTGRSTGPHLHFEVHIGTWNMEKSNAVDPMKLLKR